jgi:hypothetical protein
MVIRNGKDKKELTATLKKIYRNYHCCSKTNLLKELGVELAEIDKDDQKNVRNGLKVTKLYDGKLKSTRTFEGFIITLSTE